MFLLTMTQTVRRQVRASLFLLVVVAAVAEVNPPSGTYPSGFSRALKLGGELSEALPQKFADQLSQEVIALQPQDVPVVTPVAVTGDNRIIRQVTLSAGFIEMVNHICHAKAVDRIQPGFFDQYVKNYAQLSAANLAAPPPPIV